MKFDYFIIGHGLAGSTLAWALISRGVKALVIDPNREDESSKIAAGIVTPVTGPRFALTWRFEELLPAAKRFYGSLEKDWGVQFFHRRPVARLFGAADEAGTLARKRQSRPDIAELTGPLASPLDSSRFHARFGGFQMDEAYQLNTLRYLEASHLALLRTGAFAEGDFDWRGVDPDKPFVYGDAIADRVISCEGFRASMNPYFSSIPFRHAKGEILDLDFDCPEEPRIINLSGRWALRSREGVWKTGSTFDWNDLNPEPTDSGRATLLEQFRQLVKAPVDESHVVCQRAGIRPVIRGGKIALGWSPEFPRIGLFNGLGSKGTLRAPFYAERFAEWIVNGTPPEHAVQLPTLLAKNHPPRS